MANWSRRTRNVAYHEYLVARPARAEDVEKAMGAAEFLWKQQNEDRQLPGDWCLIDADDENIIIRLTVEKVGPS